MKNAVLASACLLAAAVPAAAQTADLDPGVRNLAAKKWPGTIVTKAVAIDRHVIVTKAFAQVQVEPSLRAVIETQEYGRYLPDGTDMARHGKELTLNIGFDDAKQTSTVSVSGGTSGTPMAVLFGLQPAFEPLPWGDTMLVSSVASWAPLRLDARGAFAKTVDLKWLRRTSSGDFGGTFFVQALALSQFAGDTPARPWPVVTSQGVKLVLSENQGRRIYQGPPVECGIVQTDSIPPFYGLYVTVTVPRAGYRFELDRVVRDDNRARAMLTLSEPGSPTTPAILERLHAFADFGTNLPSDLEIWIRIQRGDRNEPSPYGLAKEILR